MAGHADVTSLNGKVGKKICPKGMIETVKSANSSRPIASIVCVPYVKNAQKLTCPIYNSARDEGGFYDRGNQSLLVDIDNNESPNTQAFQRPGCEIGWQMKYDNSSYLECKMDKGNAGSEMPGSESLKSECREGYDLQPFPQTATKREEGGEKKVCNDNTLVGLKETCPTGNKIIYTLKCKLKTTSGSGITSYAERLTCNDTFRDVSMGFQSVTVKNCDIQIDGIYNFGKNTNLTSDYREHQCQFDTNTYNKSLTYDYREPLKTEVFRGFLTPEENCSCVFHYAIRN
jgi:hypothetical protein